MPEATTKQLPAVKAPQSELLKTTVEKVILQGNLKDLNPNEKISYYRAICEHLDLDPVTHPFDLIWSDGKLTLYPNARCAQQLNQKHKISHSKPEVTLDSERKIILAWVQAKAPDGRENWDCGAVSYVQADGSVLAPEKYAAAYKKSVTQAKRRSTLGLFGLQGGDEQEELLAVGVGAVSSEGIINVETTEVETKAQTNAETEKPAPKAQTEKPAAKPPAKNGAKSDKTAGKADKVESPPDAAEQKKQNERANELMQFGKPHLTPLEVRKILESLGVVFSVTEDKKVNASGITDEVAEAAIDRIGNAKMAAEKAADDDEKADAMLAGAAQ